MADNRAQIVISAENRADAVLKSVRAQLGGLAGDAGLVKRAFGGLGAGLAASLTGAGLAAFFKNTADGLDRLNDVADVTGATIENISALEDVGARTGTSIDAIEGSLVKLNAQLKEADGKNDVSLALRQIGLDAEKLKQEDPAEALRQTAVALAGFADDGNKARLVQELFGRSVKEVGPLLKDLATQGKLVATVTTEQAKEAEKFNQQLLSLQKNAVDFARSISGPLLTSLNDLFDTAKRSGGLEALDRLFGFDRATFDLNVLKRNSEAASAEVERVTNVLVGLSNTLERDPGNEAAQRRYDSLRVKLFELQKQAQLTNNALKIGADAFDPRGGQSAEDALSRRLGRGEAKPSVGLPAPSIKAAKQQQDDADAYLKKLQDQYVGTLELTTAERALIDIRASGFKGLTPELEKLILQQAEILDQDKALAEQRKRTNELIEEGIEIERAFGEEGVRIFNATRTPLEKLNIELERLNLLQQRGTLDWDTYKRAVVAAQDEFTKTTEEGKAAVTSLDEFTLQAARNIQDQLGTSLYEAASGNFKNIGDDFARLLLRMSTQAVAADIGRKLFGEAGKDGKGLSGGFLGDLLSSLGGGFGSKSTGDFSRMDRGQSSGSSAGGYFGTLASLFSGFFADGGYVPPGRWGIAGERGPEPIFGGRTGVSVQAAGRQSAINVVNNFTLNQPASRNTQQQVAAQAGRGIQRALARNG